MGDDSWALVFLLRFSRKARYISDAQRVALAARAVAYGRTNADSFVNDHLKDVCTQRIEDAIKDMHCVLVYNSNDTICPFLSDFDPNRSIITLYSCSISKYSDLVEKRFAECFTKYTLDDMCMLHELCHVMEYREKGTIGRLFVAKSERGMVNRNIWLRQLSEIAAHSFVQEVLQLPISPGEFDL